MASETCCYFLMLKIERYINLWKYGNCRIFSCVDFTDLKKSMEIFQTKKIDTQNPQIWVQPYYDMIYRSIFIRILYHQVCSISFELYIYIYAVYITDK